MPALGSMPGGKPGLPGKAIEIFVDKEESWDDGCGAMLCGYFCGDGAEDGKFRDDLGAHYQRHRKTFAFFSGYGPKRW